MEKTDRAGKIRGLFRPRILTRWALVRLALLFLFLVTGTLGLGSCMIFMPGESHRGELPPMSETQRLLAGTLRRDVVHLAETIGDRNSLMYDALCDSVDYLESRFHAAGFRIGGEGDGPVVRRRVYTIGAREYVNLEAEVAGTSLPEEIVIVGGHYDSVRGCPGANDNATGVAGVLALAEIFAKSPSVRTLRFVAWVNEEPPFFQTDRMGSRVHARECAERGERILAAVSLETIGCFLDEEGTQNYPPPLGMLYPNRGNFIAFVGNVASRGLVRRAVKTFRETAAFPSEGAALPGWMTGVGWSDHWSYWEEGYPALMVTDTAPFRYLHYHTTADTVDKVDFERMARVVDGLEPVIRDLADN